MSKPDVHAGNSCRKHGGNPSDFISIHNFMDSSKAFEPSNKHRIFFHSSAGCFYVEKMFGINYDKLKELRQKYNLPEEFIGDYENQREVDRNSGTQLRTSEGKKFSVREIAETHTLEDFNMRFIPTPGDYFENMELKDWMNNSFAGSSPTSKKSKAPHVDQKKTISIEDMEPSKERLFKPRIQNPK